MADAATLDDLYEAVFTAVETLGPAGTGDFKAVVEFGGQLTPETLSQAVSNRFPAALIAVAGEDVGTAEGVSEFTSGEMHEVVRASLVIYIAVQSIRGARQAHQGGVAPTGPKGLFALHSLVLRALNGLVIPELWGNGHLRYERLRSALFQPGNTGVSCVYAIGLQADRIAEQVDPDATDVPFEQFQGGVNVPEPDGEDLSNVNPVANAAVDFEEP